MTTGERINNLRKIHLKLTLEEFGNRVGVTKVAISRIENGERNLSDQMCRSICREFHVNETWLRTGEGEMLSVQSRDAEIERFLNDVLNSGQDAFKRRLVAALSVLDEKEWEVFEKIVDSIASKAASDQSSDPGRMAAGTEEMSVEEAEAIYKSSLSDARKQDAGVLNTTGDAGERPA